jgi:hypothetical protein
MIACEYEFVILAAVQCMAYGHGLKPRNKWFNRLREAGVQGPEDKQQVAAFLSKPTGTRLGTWLLLEEFDWLTEQGQYLKQDSNYAKEGE